MSIAKTATLSFAAAIILAAHAAPSFAAEYQLTETNLSSNSESSLSSDQDDEQSIWDYILGWL